MKTLNWQSPPQHGGDLARAKALHSDISPDDWLDLSAGLNPQPWPIPQIPIDCFTRLPEDYSALLTAAAEYYQQESLWPVSGSQQIIELLPKLRQNACVAVPEVGYQEHAWCWLKAGHKVMTYCDDELEQAAETYDVVVVINPNNPGGQRYPQARLLTLQQRLASRNGWLIVDEAFMDALSEQDQAESSLTVKAQLDGLIVLRSIGKFFGLAGIRSGFVLCQQALLDTIRQGLGPWHMNGVSAYLTQQLLLDREWHYRARATLSLHMNQQRLQLDRLFEPQGRSIGYTPLFYTCYHPAAYQLQQQLAQQGIWVRYFSQSSWLRFGLADNPQALGRLVQALDQSLNQSLKRRLWL
ncbi:threonine-phosphate decarboxylase CobD [Oceanospirillum beijerinckii]|uniref:threonine-phosphate decarboxylase CobD n=1 Tax=Oceanospirillum beijerinckii TaxID=64976 RepID=UPI0004177E1C|nr:threonine-phosphate decarboxylase CobD [Oceanospirillum beijerinckii]